VNSGTIDHTPIVAPSDRPLTSLLIAPSLTVLPIALPLSVRRPIVLLLTSLLTVPSETVLPTTPPIVSLTVSPPNAIWIGLPSVSAIPNL
jgi:hypothetical protein